MIEIKHPADSSEPLLYKLFIDGSLVDKAIVGVSRGMEREVVGCLKSKDG
jgi:hypothetical protein